jgi:hypothetical protein
MRLLLFTSILVFLTACHSLRHTPQAYKRCSISPKEYTLLSDPPENSEEFLALAGIKQMDNDSDFLWFSADNKFALCRSPKLREFNRDRINLSCGSSLWKFNYNNGQLQGGGISSIFVCHG